MLRRGKVTALPLLPLSDRCNATPTSPPNGFPYSIFIPIRVHKCSSHEHLGSFNSPILLSESRITRIKDAITTPFREASTGIRTRNELRYYKRRGKMPHLRVRVVPKSVKKPKNKCPSMNTKNTCIMSSVYGIISRCLNNRYPSLV